MSHTPIGDHALLSDRHSSALVDSAGSVEWLSFPRFDSPSVFGRLLGPDAGHWQISPVGASRSRRRYVDQTLVLETTFTAATGTLVLTDAMALGPDNGGHRLGVDAPHLLVRRVACTEGDVEVRVSYVPRPEYGLVIPLLSAVEGGLTGRGGADWLVLTTPVTLELSQGAASGAYPPPRGSDSPPGAAPLDPRADPGAHLVAGGAERAARRHHRLLAFVVRAPPDV